MTIEEAISTLRQFVIRAVHIEAHSFAGDRGQLEKLAQGAWRVTLALDQSASVERELPDEERMESLASRVRPLTLASEPIHHAKVMEAIDTALDHCSDQPVESHRARVAEIRDDWLRHGLDQNSWFRYQVSMIDTASSDPPAEATDVQLAAGWFYADVAHSNPTGWKVDALRFSRATRYQAAVPRWAMLAVTALRTLDHVRELRTEGVLELPDRVFVPDLATARNVPDESIVMVGPPGLPMPGLAGTALGPEWVRLNVGEAARLESGNRINVALSREGQELLRRPGAVLAREVTGNTLRMDVLVDEAVVFHVVGSSADIGSTIQSKLETVWKTNRSLSDGCRLIEYLHGSDSLAFTWEDSDHRIAYTLQPTSAAPSRSLVADYIDDIAAIEALLGIQLPLVEQIPNANDRTAMRLMRLAIEGHLVAGPGQPVDVTTTEGHPPQVVVLGMPPVMVGDATMPGRMLWMWHPQALVESLKDGEYRVSTPNGEPFLIWDPERRRMEPDSDFTPTAQLALPQ